MPNFFLAGVPKAGTTSLHSYLQQHPQIFMSPIKEPHFFAAADLLSGARRDGVLAALERDREALASYLDGPQPPVHYRLVLTRDDYLRLFRDSTDEPVRGESSTGYFYLPAAAAAIKAASPEARLAFILRDPAERLYTRYLTHQWNDRPASFRVWFERMLDAPRPWNEPFLAGLYATHLERFISVFGRERLRMYLFEDLRADARAVLRDLFAFLGVQPDYRVDVARRHNPTFIPRFPLLHTIRRRLFGTWSPTSLLPRRIRETARSWYRRIPASRVMDPADRAMVIEYFKPEITRTQELIGRDLGAWLR